MMISNPVFFYTISVILIIFTFLTMFFKNIIYSLLSAIMVFFATAIVFYILGSEYNAIIQAAIYGLAVPVIIGISIMFTSAKRGKRQWFTRPYITLFAATIFAMALIYATMISLVILPDTFNYTELLQTSSYENILSFAKGIFVNHVFPFELISLLLTVTIAGLTLFKARRVE